MQSSHAKFFSTLLLFLGTGFVSGAIVHSAGVFAWYEFSLLCIGGLLFTLGAYLQVKQSLVVPKGTLTAYLGLSFALSIGIGILSGGIQHFLDTPRFAAVMVAVGLPLGGILYLIREQAVPKKKWFKVYGTYVVIGLALAGITYPIAQYLEPSDSHRHSVTGEEEFLQEMVPHHREAVIASTDILTRSTNPKITDFAKSVIQIQSSEIAQMSDWYTAWYGKPLVAARYTPMMQDLGNSRGPAAEQTYLQDMILHHKAAIAMADSIRSLSPRPELLKLAESIKASQTDEIAILTSLLAENTASHGKMYDKAPHAHGDSHKH